MDYLNFKKTKHNRKAETATNFHWWERETSKILPSWVAKELHTVRVLKASFLLRVWLLKLRANLEPAQLPDPDHRLTSGINLSPLPCPWPYPANWGCGWLWFPSPGLVLTPTKGQPPGLPCFLAEGGRRKFGWWDPVLQLSGESPPLPAPREHWSALLPGQQACTPF